MATGIKELAKGRADQYRLSPNDLHVKEGWNARASDYDENDPEDVALAQSIAEVGVKETLTVYWEDGKAFVSNGHRRRAASLVAIEKFGADKEMTVPVVTEHRNADEAERVFSMIVRNAGKPLSPLEQGVVYKRLVDLGWSDSIIAKKAGISRVHVSNLVALVEAPKTLTDLVRSGEVSSTLAISTLNKHKGEAKAAAKELKAGVKEAKKAGKTRATAKHVRKAAEKKRPSKEKPTETAAPKDARSDLKDVVDELRKLLTEHEVTVPHDLIVPDRDDLYLIPISADAWDRVRDLFRIAKGASARDADLV